MLFLHSWKSAQVLQTNDCQGNGGIRSPVLIKVVIKV